MKCEEVQERLSEYLEGLLDRDAAGRVRDHLTACARCREELGTLTETRRAVNDLPAADPPAGFTQRVMARVREEADRPKLFHRLFLPIHLKIPIHALALLLVGGIAVYLYQSYPPAQPVLPGSTPSEPEPMARRELVAPEARVPESAESFNRPMAEEKLKKTITDEAARAPAIAGKSEEAVGELKSATPPVEAVVDFRLGITPRGPFKDAKVMDSKLEELAKQMGGKYIRPRENIASLERDDLDQSGTVLLVIPADRYDRFKTELASVGKIEEEVRAVPSSPDAGTSSSPRPPAKTSPFLKIQLILRPAGNP